MCSPDQVATQRAITAVDAEKGHTVISQADYNAKPWPQKQQSKQRQEALATRVDK